jgi:hypothetical protein
MRILKKLWYGQYPLWTTFWSFYVGGYLLISFAGITIFNLSGGAAPVRTVGIFIQTAYLFVASVGVWVSADHAVSQPQAWTARFTVLLLGLAYVVNIFRTNPELLNNFSGG